MPYRSALGTQVLIIVLGATFAGCDSRGGDGAKSGAPATAAQPGSPAAASQAPAPTPSNPPPVKPGLGNAPAAAAAPAAAGVKAPTVTPSGLEYTLVREGTGSPPPLGSSVKVRYTGRLPNGKVFHDTRNAANPEEFLLDSSKLIAGWVEALLEMRPGEVRRLRVPSQLGYGEGGYPGVVPPSTDLSFELELVSFVPPKQ